MMTNRVRILGIRFLSKTFFILTALAALTVLGGRSLYADGPLRVWPADIHEKIFMDTEPGEFGPIRLRAARGEYESGQFGVVSEEARKGVTLSVSALSNEDGTSQIAADQIRLRPIDTVRVTKNTPAAQEVAVRPAPADYPDILREDSDFSLKAGEGKGIWLTILVPTDAKPGRYTGTVTAVAADVRADIPIELEVFAFTLPAERHLWVTNWFDAWNMARVHNVSIWSEEFWPVLKRYFDNMAAHRQNVIRTPWVPDNSFVKATHRVDGTWNVDFSRLERFLALAEESGVAERIELTHCAGIDRNQHLVQFQSATVWDEKEGKPVSLSADEWLAPVLSALENWLVETGRIDRAMIHVADEPYREDMASWRAASARIHEIAPRLRRIDAVESLHFTDELEVWVPKLSHFDRWRNGFERMRGDKEKKIEMWFYICCHPFGEHYPNRFMDLPGTRIRSLHWLNFTEHLTGYLHWGYNFWVDDPFGPPTEIYGPGDTHAVYPGPLDSVRWEIERESLEDFEYFTLLKNLTEKVKSETDADLWWLEPECRGMEIARRVVHSPADIEIAPSVFAEARLDLAREIESLTEGPRLIVRTFPEDNGRLVVGPVLIEIYGLTTPGAVVTVDGKPVDVAADGTFETTVVGEPQMIEFTATLDGKTVKTVRRFKTP